SGGGAASLELESAADLHLLRSGLRPRGAGRIAPDDVLVLVEILLVLRRGVPDGRVDRGACEGAVQRDLLRGVRRGGRRAGGRADDESGRGPGICIVLALGCRDSSECRGAG